MQGPLDAQEQDTNIAGHLLQMVYWWEQRRLPYNAMVVLAGVIGIAVHGQGYLDNGELVILVGFYLLLANLCYCLGWGLEILIWVYFKLRFRYRQALFLIGTLFSVLFTYALSTGA